MSEQRNRISVAIPVYNEERNLPALLDSLLGEAELENVLVADDGSTDGSPSILREYSRRDSKIVSLHTGGRAGPLAGWRIAVEAAKTPFVLLIDADTRPSPGAIRILLDAVSKSAEIAVASGRVVPINDLTSYPAGRFRATAIHKLRLLGFPRDAVIGRLAMVRRAWFCSSVTEAGIIACDAYLGCLAVSCGLKALYVPGATCRYTEVTNLFDFASQRQRADKGYRQLRRMGIIRPGYEPSIRDYVRVLASAALEDPGGAAAWAREQVRGKFVHAYTARPDGSWDALDTTKELH